MTGPVPLAEIWRGAFLESLHLGHAVICDGTGQISRYHPGARRGALSGQQSDPR